MAWTYDTTLETELSQVRLLIGDTESTQPQLTDEELTFLIDSEGNIYRAAAAACRALMAEYARKVDKAVGDLKINYSQRMKAYESLGKSLFIRGGGLGIPSAGGVYVADREANEGNESIIQPAIKIGIHDF